MSNPLAQLQAFLQNEIPVLGHMGVQAIDYDAQSIRLRAPLALNTNHRKTAFGGSIATLGIAAGWALLHLRMQDATLRCGLVVQKSETEFIAPVTADFEVECRLQDETDWLAFAQQLNSRGRARISLTAVSYCDGQIVARHLSQYAAIQE